MSQEVFQELAETVAEVGRALADGHVDIPEAVKLAAKAIKLLSGIPLQRPRAALLKAAKHQEGRAARLARKGHDKAAARHEKRAKALRAKAEDAD